MTPKLDLATLRIFLAVAKTQNITKAAEGEHIAVSAVSKRLSDIEQMFGTKLFYRVPRGVQLTPAGEVFEHHARTILRSVDRLAADLGDYSQGIKGHVRIMANTSSISEFLPKDLSRFCEKYPEISVDVQEVNSAESANAIVEGRCDIAVFVGVEDEQLGGCQVHDYRIDNFVLVVPVGHRFAKRKSMRFEEALDEYFVGPEAMTAWDETISFAALEARQTVRYRMRLKNVLSIINMVAAGLGITVVPSGLLAPISRATGLQPVELEDVWAKRTIRVAAREEDAMSPPAKLMLSHLRNRG